MLTGNRSPWSECIARKKNFHRVKRSKRKWTLDIVVFHQLKRFIQDQWPVKCCLQIKANSIPLKFPVTHFHISVACKRKNALFMALDLVVKRKINRKQPVFARYLFGNNLTTQSFVIKTCLCMVFISQNDASLEKVPGNNGLETHQRDNIYSESL